MAAWSYVSPVVMTTKRTAAGKAGEEEDQRFPPPYSLAKELGYPCCNDTHEPTAVPTVAQRAGDAEIRIDPLADERGEEHTEPREDEVARGPRQRHHGGPRARPPGIGCGHEGRHTDVVGRLVERHDARGLRVRAQSRLPSRVCERPEAGSRNFTRLPVRGPVRAESRGALGRALVKLRLCATPPLCLS